MLNAIGPDSCIGEIIALIIGENATKILMTLRREAFLSYVANCSVTNVAPTYYILGQG